MSRVVGLLTARVDGLVIAPARRLEYARAELGEAGIGYATRVGRETVLSVGDALEDANALYLAGLGAHLDATAACVRCPLGQAYVSGRMVRSVGGAVADAHQASLASIELRTPPSEWTAAPPLQLFAERPS